MTKAEIFVFGCSLVLLGFLLWKEWRRMNRSHLPWRMWATVIAMISFACMALPLYYSRTETRPALRTTVLLTEGFYDDSVAAFLRTNKNIPVYTLDETLLAAKKHNAILLSDPSDLPGGGLHIFGYGLHDAILNELPPQPVFFHPSNPTGFTAVHWKPLLPGGEKLVVQGSFTNNTSAAQKLVLSGYHTALDSVMVNPNSQRQFSLATMPKQYGRGIYFISAISKKDTIEKQPVAVQVQEPKQLRILLLAASPDFENKFLRNWLAEKGYPVFVRTAISKNKFSKEFLNMAPLSADRITTAMLDKFDVIVADALELASISKGELGILRSYVIQKKKGLVIKADSARSAFYATQFPLVRADSATHEVNLSMADSSVKLPPLTIDQTHIIKPQNGSRPLLRDRQNRSFVSSALYGSGKIVLSTLSNTFTWALSGNSESYQAVWSEILNTAASKESSPEQWQTAPLIPRVNEPATIHLYNFHHPIPQGEIEAASVYFTGHYDLPYLWTASFWPKKSGWQTGIQLNGEPWYWYVYAQEEWKNQSARHRIAATQLYLQTNQQPPKALDPKLQNEKIPVKKLWFFLFFLLCAGYLWFENKYYNR